MNSGLKVTGLQLNGTESPQYFDLKRNSNLLFIYGPIAKGKTLLANLIAYGLGKGQLKLVQELESFNDVLVQVELEGVEYTICRDLRKAASAILIHKGNLKTFSKEQSDRYQQRDVGGTGEVFSWFLLDKLNTPAFKSVPQNINSNSKPSLVSFNDIFQFSYLSQEKIDADLPLGLDNFAMQKAQDAFELIFNINPPNRYELDLQRLEVVTKKENLDSKRKFLSGFIESYELYTRQDLDYGINKHQKELSELKDKLTEFNFNETMTESDLNTNNTFEINETEQKIQTELGKLLSIKNTIEKWEPLLNSYRLERQQLFLTARANLLLGEINFKSCPSCSQKIDDVEDTHCGVCKREKPFILDDNRDLNDRAEQLSIKEAELFEKIQTAKNTCSGIEVRIDEFQTKLLQLKNDTISKRTLNIDPKIVEYRELCLSAGNLESKLEFLKHLRGVYLRLERLENDITNLASDEEKIAKAIAEIDAMAADKKNAVLNKMSTILNDILSTLNMPEEYKHEVDVDRKKYYPTWKGKPYTAVSSGGLKVYFSVAYYLAFLETTLETADNYYPKFLIIDSIHKNISTFHDIDRQSLQLLYKRIVDIAHRHKDMQIIVIDNELPDFVLEMKDNLWDIGQGLIKLQPSNF